MNKINSVFDKFSNILNYFIVTINRFSQLNKFRNKFSLELLVNKYLANYKNIVFPFRESLPLIKYGGNPVLKEGKPGEWDETGPREPFILFNAKKYFLYYESRTFSKELDWQIGVATADKITGPWKKNLNNPILRYSRQENDYDKQCVADPCVVYHKGKYHMWFDMYDGKIWRIGKAYSSNGLKWEKFKKNGKTQIILDIGKKNAWDHKLVHCPEVYLWNKRVHILYGAVGIGQQDYNTGLAIQDDENGEIFRKWCQVTNNEMFGKDLITSRMQAGFILKGIIFTGLRVKIKNQNETTFIVFSDDGGKSWNKLSETILNTGNQNEWDSKLFYGPNCWVISENKLWTAYLGGKKDNLRRLGLAYMEIPDIK